MVFRVGDDPVACRWYFTDPEAAFFDSENSFASQNWDSRQATENGLGETGTRRWYNGKDVKAYPTPPIGQCIDPSWFATGVPSMETTGPWEVDGSRFLCCDTGPPPDTGCDALATFNYEVLSATGSASCATGETGPVPQTFPDQWEEFAVGFANCGFGVADLRVTCGLSLHIELLEPLTFSVIDEVFIDPDTVPPVDVTLSGTAPFFLYDISVRVTSP